MEYSVFPLLALVQHLIINHDIIFNINAFNPKADIEYKRFLTVVFLFFVVDTAWGLFDAWHLHDLLYVSTVVHYLLTTLTVIFWCNYVMKYIDTGRISTRVIKALAAVVFTSCLVMIVANFFTSIFFDIDGDGVYHMYWGRYLTFIFQIMLVFDITALSAWKISISESGSRRRYISIFIFGILSLISIVAQIYHPHLPYYTIGLMLGTSMLHTFVQEDERDEVSGQLLKNEKRLKEAMDIITSSDMGVWNITLADGLPPSMEADAKMKELLGIPDKNITGEEIYRMWYSGIDKDALVSVQNSVDRMLQGFKDENTYKWHHPVLGERYVRCGGTSAKIPGGYLISGYHYDVTDQKKNEIRANLIISSFAQSYSFINYILMNEGTYITYKGNVNLRAEVTKALNIRDINECLDFICDNLILGVDHDRIKTFADLRTINERMKDKLRIEEQFKAYDGRWYAWSYVVSDRNDDGSIKHLLWAIRKIDDEKQIELQQKKLLDDSIAANKAKTLFLQNMSHEIRTPLNAMFGFSQLLGMPDGTWSEEEREEYNKFIFNSYNMLDMLIGDILDIADSESGNYHIEMGSVLVNAACRNAMMSVEYRKPSSVKLYYTSEVDDDYTALSDGRRIQQVIINYLTNACKHTSKGEIHLHCSLSEHPGRLTFSVTDTGTGVPADKADFIFNRFTKLDNFVQGSGLGLNICQMVASKMGGEVYLDKSYTGGARFVFVIDAVRA